MCDGPPASQIRMQFLRLAVGVTAPGARATRQRPEPEEVVEPQAEGAQDADAEQRGGSGRGTVQAVRRRHGRGSRIGIEITPRRDRLND